MAQFGPEGSAERRSTVVPPRRETARGADSRANRPSLRRARRTRRGILAFAERVLPRAADRWVQASLDQRQRFQQLFFPDGIAFDGNRLIRTGTTAAIFSYLREMRTRKEGLVDQNSASW